MKHKITHLYHFTCDHGYAGIAKTGILLPNIHPFMKSIGPFLWLTDYAEPPSKESVGLTASWTTCDRLAYRYIVHCKAVIHWFDIRQRAPQDVVADLEAFGEPEHWFIARRPIMPSEFTFDDQYRHNKNGEK